MRTHKEILLTFYKFMMTLTLLQGVEVQNKQDERQIQEERDKIPLNCEGLIEKKTEHKTIRGDQPTHSVNKTTGEDKR